MRATIAAALVLAGCSAPPPAASPPEPGFDAARVLGDAIDALRLSAGYTASFEGSLAEGGGSPLRTSGRAEWFRGGVLKLRLDQSGGRRDRILRVGGEAWVYDAAGETWLPAAAKGLGGAGSGLENPDEVLGAIRPNLAGARRIRQERTDAGVLDVVELTAAGEALRAIVGPLGAGRGLDFAASRGTVRAWTDGKVVRRVAVEARIGPGDVRYAGEVAIESVAPVLRMEFDDVPSPWSDEMKSAARKAAQERKR